MSMTAQVKFENMIVCQCAKIAFGNEAAIRDLEELAGDSLQNLAKELSLPH